MCRYMSCIWIHTYFVLHTSKHWNLYMYRYIHSYTHYSYSVNIDKKLEYIVLLRCMRSRFSWRWFSFFVVRLSFHVRVSLVRVKFLLATQPHHKRSTRLARVWIGSLSLIGIQLVSGKSRSTPFWYVSIDLYKNSFKHVSQKWSF